MRLPVLLLPIGLMVVFVTCCESDKPSSSEQAGPWLTRVSTPDSSFKPAALETAIETVVEELNRHEPNPNLQLSVLPKNVDGYFAPVVLGANRAIDELDVRGVVLGPSSGDDEELQTSLQMEYMEDHIRAGYVGVGLASMRADLCPLIDEAVDKGMTVVTFDSDEPTSKRQLYVGTINREAGAAGGETLVELLGDRNGTVVILGHEEEDWIDGYNRTESAREVIEAAGNAVVVRQVDWAAPEEDVAFMQEALTSAEPPAVGMIGLFSNAYLCVDAAVAAEMENDLQIVAFDFEEETLAYMDQGFIQVTHAQRQYYMGYLIPYIILAADVIGLEETKAFFSEILVEDDKIHTGLDVVQTDQLEEYNQFLESLGIS